MQNLCKNVQDAKKNKKVLTQRNTKTFLSNTVAFVKFNTAPLCHVALKFWDYSKKAKT